MGYQKRKVFVDLDLRFAPYYSYFKSRPFGFFSSQLCSEAIRNTRSVFYFLNLEQDMAVFFFGSSCVFTSFFPLSHCLNSIYVYIFFSLAKLHQHSVSMPFSDCES